MKLVKLYHPFKLLFRKKFKGDTFDDLTEYGFSFDLTTEILIYGYEWGYGMCFRLLGFGFELTFLNKL